MGDWGLLDPSGTRSFGPIGESRWGIAFCQLPLPVMNIDFKQ
jgi:hypothetical protein